MRLASLCVAALVALAVAPARGQEAADELVGVWVVESVTTPDGMWNSDPAQPGLFIFSGGGHYSAVFSIAPRPHSAAPFGPTDEEKVGQYDSIIVNTGTYEVSGRTVTTRPMIAKSPEFVGGEAAWELEIDGDALTLRGKGISAHGASLPGGDVTTLRRLE